jgi:penicillin-binding protein 2
MEARPPPPAWYPGETLILGIGQGYMQATPLQLAQATALMATRGKWIRPHLAQKHRGEPPVDPNPMPDIQLRDPRSGITRELSAWNRCCMAPAARRQGRRTSAYRIAGKSGTAQVVAIKPG